MQERDEIANLGSYLGRDGVLLVGRVLMSLIFIGSGWNRVDHFADTAGFIASLGVPAPDLFNGIEIVIEGLGGLAILTGLLFRFATLGIIASTIVASFLVHRFWTMSGNQGLDQYFHFMKNACIVGVLLFFNVMGAGRFSLTRMWDPE